MSTFSDVSKKYTTKQLEKFVYDSLVPGWCKVCKKPVAKVEPDAEDYPCSKCGTHGAVSSVLIILGII